MQLKKHFSTFILAIVGIFLLSSPAQATHMAGSDMEIKCLGKDTFKIILRVYRDCNGIPINANPVLGFGAVECSQKALVGATMTRTLVRPVRFMCGGQKNICEGGSFPFGMEENRFEVTVALQNLFPGGLDSTCCWIKVVYSECCRNGSITNINPGQFHIEGLINRCVSPCNSSPQITNYPVAVICNGQPFWFNNGILDTVDYDSISYEMTDPLNLTGPENWLGGYNKDRPLQFLGFPNNTLPFPAGFHLIPTTGDLGFTSTAIQQPVLAFKISEWRKINGVYQLIGVTRRDVQFFTYQCPPNNPPVLKVNGSTTGPFTFTACAGTTLCINITATDKDSAAPLGPDTTKLSWNRGIPQGTFTTTNSPVNLVREDEGVFCWTPTDNYVSSLPYYFTVKAEDDNCPVPATATRAIGIRVKARPLGNRTITPKGCSKFGLDVTVTNQDKLTQTPSFQWTVPNVGNGVFNAVNAVTYNTKTVLSHTFPEGGTYVTRLRMEADGCTNFVFDTIQVDSPVKSIAPIDTFACIGGGKTFVGSAKNGKQPYSFRWIYPSASTADTNVISVSPLVTAKYILEVKDSFLCLSYDTVELEIKALPQVNLGPDRRICFKDSVIFDAGDNNGKGLIAYNWITPKGTPDDKVIYGGDSGQYYVMVTDSFMCQKSDSALLFVNREVIADAGPGDSLCIFDATTLRGSGGDTYEWTETISPNVLSNKDTLFLNPQISGTKDYTLKVSVTYGNVTCYDYDETRVLTHPLPTITFTNKYPKFCITDQWLDPGIKSGMQPVSNPSTGAFTYWTIRDSAKRQCFDLDPNSPNFGMVKLSCLGISGKNGNPPCWQLIVVHKDKYGCINTDSICVTIWDLPVVWAGPDTIVCGNDLPVAITPYPNFGVGSEWLSPPSPKTNIPNPVLEYLPLPRKHTFYPARASQDTTYMLVYKATDNNGCENQDTAIYFVKPVPVVNAGVLADICEDVGVIDLHIKSGATPTGGTWTSEPPIPALNTTSGLFDPKGSGVIYGKFPFNVLRYTYTNAVGCTESDTTKLIVYKLPNTKLTVPDTAVCENRTPFAMNGSPKGPGGLYFINGTQLGPNQSYNTFDPKASIVNEGINKVLFTFKDPQTKCQKNDSTLIRVQRLPEVTIIPPGALCQGLPFTIRGTMAKTTSFRWSTEQKSGNFTGMFNNITDTFATDSVVSYLPGSKDIVNGSFAVILQSTDNGLCPAAYKRQVIKINPQPEGDFTAIQEGCEPFNTLFEGQFTGAEYYRWNFGDSGAVSNQSPTYHISEGGEFSPAHTYKKYGTYPVSVYLRSTDGCDTTITKPDFIKVNRTPIAFFEPDKSKTTVALPRFTFINKSMRSENDGSELIQDIDSVMYSWDFGSPKTDGDTSSAKSPTYTYDAEVGEFMVVLNLVTNKGCASEYSEPVKIEPDITVFAPNAFRPQSGQERNQRFYIEVDGQMTFHLDIFSRWGELVYASDNKDEGWDGKFKSVDCQQDVYAWQVTVTSYNGTIYKYSGTVNLMR